MAVGRHVRRRRRRPRAARSLTLVGQAAEIRRVNLHTPNNSTPDSGLTARYLALDLQDSLSVGGWLIGTELVGIDVANTAGDFSVVTDAGSTIKQAGDSGTLLLRGNKALRIAGQVLAEATGANPQLQAGTRLDLLAGADVATTGAELVADADLQRVPDAATGQHGPRRRGRGLLFRLARVYGHRGERPGRDRRAARTGTGRSGGQQRRSADFRRPAVGGASRGLPGPHQQRPHALPRAAADLRDSGHRHADGAGGQHAAGADVDRRRDRAGQHPPDRRGVLAAAAVGQVRLRGRRVERRRPDRGAGRRGGRRHVPERRGQPRYERVHRQDRPTEHDASGWTDRRPGRAGRGRAWRARPRRHDRHRRRHVGRRRLGD